MLTSNINYLWEHGDEKSWNDALKHYYDVISEKNMPLELELEKIHPEQIEAMSVTEFYDFLHDKYFIWKYTQKNRLATTRRNLEKYIQGNNLNDLETIKKGLFSADLNNTDLCLFWAAQIRGLGFAGASGLLAILFPQKYGTVDQFVVKSLLKVENLQEHEALTHIKPNYLSGLEASILIGILRRQAQELNARFHSTTWTPRKIDMVLWSIER